MITCDAVEAVPIPAVVAPAAVAVAASAVISLVGDCPAATTAALPLLRRLSSPSGGCRVNISAYLSTAVETLVTVAIAAAAIASRHDDVLFFESIAVEVGAGGVEDGY